MPSPEVSTIRFATADDVELIGDLALPAGAARAAAIVCHPHPQYGGDRYNPMVGALFDTLAASGIAALRFDFRSGFDDGRGERLDAVAAIERITEAVADVPVIATGYSFGAAIAAGIDDGRIAARALVAPPLAMMAVEPRLDVPTLVLTPEHDQFSPPDITRAAIEDWPRTELRIVADADHFLGATPRTIATAVVEWLDGVLG